MEKTLSFPKIFNSTTGKTNLSEGSKSIKECLLLLINSMPNELLGDPMYGSGILENTFDYKGQLLYEDLRSKIFNIVLLYEPRVTLEMDGIQFEIKEELIIISLTYFIKQEGTYDNTTLVLETGGNL